MAQHLKFLKKVLNFSAERYLRIASDVFVYDGDYETALVMVNKALEIDSQDMRALVLKGDILFCLNKDQEALVIFDEVLSRDKNCTEAYISKSGVLDALNYPQEALECCRIAYRLMDANSAYLLPSLYDQMISLLVRLKKYRQAQRLLKESQSRLHEDDYQYLVLCYQSVLNTNRARNREDVMEQVQKLSWTVFHNDAAPKKGPRTLAPVLASP